MQKQLVGLLVVLFILVSFSAFALARDMKIGVAAHQPDQQAAISEVAGRAGYLLFFDKEGNFLEAIKNPSVTKAGGAGRDTADLLKKNEVTLFVAGRVGERMKNALQRHQIEYFEKKGVADEVVKSILQDH